MVYLYWSSRNIFGFISAGIMMAGFVLLIKQYRKSRHRHLLYFVFMVLFVFLTIFFDALTELLKFNYIGGFFGILYWPLLILSRSMQLGMVFFSIILADSISRESVDIKKIALYCIEATAFMVTDLASFYIGILLWKTPGASEMDLDIAEPVQSMLANTWYIFYTLNILIGLWMVFYWCLKVHKNSPRSLRRYSTLCMIGAIILLLVPMQIVVGVFIPTFISSTELTFIEVSVGTLLVVIGLVKEPRLAYVLPFKVLRLAVIDTGGGLMLFNHSWLRDDEVVDDQLFSGMIQGIGMILDEAVRRGNVEEIKLNKAILILERSEKYPVACVLVASNSSRSLRIALSNFASKFYSQFSQHFNPPYETTVFEPAKELVEECFQFVPEYD
ncbi:MAG: hypothetical protein ACFFCS_19505 [Candidatus Hodarchaeota archaeon]